jgi:hypothetical protein
MCKTMGRFTEEDGFLGDRARCIIKRAWRQTSDTLYARDKSIAAWTDFLGSFIFGNNVETRAEQQENVQTRTDQQRQDSDIDPIV